MGRYIVMHGGWYVEEDFIKKYGRAGRSWGCPAVPLAFSKKIIDAIKNKSLFVAYYPDEDWLKKSRFLHCSSLSSIRLQQEQPLPIEAQEQRESILFADMNNNHKREESEPVVAIEAQNYQKIFQTIAPLERMLRRQIEKKEYIALNSKELDTLVQTKSSFLQQIFFVTPVIKMQRGYYETTMQPLALGKIASVQMHTAIPDTTYTVHFEKNSAILLRPYHHFIRWVGL
jgi:hypothetical protein